MKCRVCKKTKEKPADARVPYCAWDGTGDHPRFVRYTKVRRKPEMGCANCPEPIYMRDQFWKDMETGEFFCFDCGMLIFRGIEYADKRKEKDAA